MCAAFDNRSSSVAPEHSTHSAKNIPSNLFGVHGTTWEYISMTNHVWQPRANHVPCTSPEPPLGLTSSTDGLRTARVAERNLKTFLTSVLDGGRGTAPRSSSIISGWKAPVANTQNNSLAEYLNVTTSRKICFLVQAAIPARPARGQYPLGNRQLVNWTRDCCYAESKLIIFITEPHPIQLTH
jgi:hypothetical protein